MNVVFARADITTGEDLYEIGLTTPETASVPAVQLTSLPGNEDEPSWLDATHIVYVGAGAHGTTAIHELDLAAHTDTTLIDDGFDRHHPVVDPANPDLIAYAKTVGNQGQLAVFNLTTHGETTLSDGTGNDTDPSWAPDGSLLAFQSNRAIGSSTVFQIWIVPAAGGPAHPLFTGGSGATDTQPAFAPDKVHITFVRVVTGASTDVEDTHVATMSGGTAIPASVTDLTPHEKAAQNQPDWAAVPTTGTNLPEVPVAVLLPTVGLLVAGSALALRRRRST